jgi:hypothetical protein
MMTPRTEAPRATPALPMPLETETRALLTAFLRPIIDSAVSWADLAHRLSARGYAIAFHEGRLIILDETGQPRCTAACLGLSLRDLAARLGRPCIRAHRDGRSGRLH